MLILGTFQNGWHIVDPVRKGSYSISWLINTPGNGGWSLVPVVKQARQLLVTYLETNPYPSINDV
jgi:hypothetical protein